MRNSEKALTVRCSGCGTSSGETGPLGNCPKCGGILAVEYSLRERDLRSLASLFEGAGVWRYSKLLPVTPRDKPISLGEGGTALLRSQRLGEVLGMGKLFLKNETTNPTGSFVDRGVTVEMTHALDSGYSSVACALSGNLAASVAAYSARAGIRSKALLPLNTDIGKLYQIVAYGADIIQIRDQEDAENSLRGMGEDIHIITPQSPFFLEGIKSTCFEIAEQMDWNPPDRIVLSIGSGAHLAMIWKALGELEKIGLIDSSVTRLTGVQMEACAPIVEALGIRHRGVRGDSKISLASEIAIHHPHMTDMVLDAIKRSRGTAVAVDEADIVDAVQLLARAEGIFAEPAAAASVAGLRNLLDTGEIDRGERVVCIITGTGLKEPITPKRAMRKVAGRRKVAMRMERRIKMLDLGATKESILELLDIRDDYGYGIWKRLREEKSIEITVVSVYQHLSELETADLIERGRVEDSPRSRTRVMYCLTPRGRRFLTGRMNLSEDRE